MQGSAFWDKSGTNVIAGPKIDERFEEKRWPAAVERSKEHDKSERHRPVQHQPLSLAQRHHGITRHSSFFLVQLESNPRSLRFFSEIVCAHRRVEVLGEDANQLEVKPPAADGRVPTLDSGVDLAHVAVLNLLQTEHED